MDPAASLLLVRLNCAGADGRTTTTTLTFPVTITITFSVAFTATNHRTAPVGRSDVVSWSTLGPRSRYRADKRRSDVVWHRSRTRPVRRTSHPNDQRSGIAW